MTGTAGQTVLRVSPNTALDELERRALGLLGERSGRLAIGLAGGPGVGKSTVAAQLVAKLNGRKPDQAALVPMDGFHMRHSTLQALGIAEQKGAPHTFEAAAFSAFLSQLKAAKAPVSVPGYSRKIEDVVEDVFTVPRGTELLVVEGNYLLLQEGPWAAVKLLLDLAVFLHVPREVVRARLLKRHGEEGLFTEERNLRHVDTVDLSNYDLVERTRGRADLVIEMETSA